MKGSLIQGGIIVIAQREISGIIIAGCGRLGCCLADQLNLADEPVTLIDINRDVFNNLTQAFLGAVVEGDASNIEILRQAGISQAKVVIAATDNDNINLMVAHIAREIYEVPAVIAIVNDSGTAAANAEFGFTVLCPSTVMTRAVLCNLKLKEG